MTKTTMLFGQNKSNSQILFLSIWEYFFKAIIFVSKIKSIKKKHEKLTTEFIGTL